MCNLLEGELWNTVDREEDVQTEKRKYIWHCERHDGECIPVHRDHKALPLKAIHETQFPAIEGTSLTSPLNQEHSDPVEMN